MSAIVETMVKACSLEEIHREGRVVISGGRHGVVLFHHDGKVSAVDNRCPHMGFPLSRGSVCDGILTCHWHHARFDLESGGTFDPFADDVRAYPTRIVDGDVWIDLNPPSRGLVQRWKRRLEESLEQSLSLVTAKSVLALRDLDVPSAEILEIGGRFGGRFRVLGWGPGLTILTALGNLLPELSPEDQVLALYHGLVRVAQDCAGEAPRFGLQALPVTTIEADRLKTWFRQFVEVRDADGSERALLTALAAGISPATVSDVMLAAATDHYFIAGGHTVDFINKAFELLERTGWDEASSVLPSVVRGLCQGQRSEEQNAWRHPIDLVELVQPIMEDLPSLLAMSRQASSNVEINERDFDALVDTLLGEDPRAIVDALVGTLRSGVGLPELSQVLAYAAAVRVARFHTSNEFGDWITVLHTFTYCNAVDQSLRRAPSPELARGIFHGAMKLYLDRFLNMPSAALPTPRQLDREPSTANALLEKLLALLDKEQQVGSAATTTARYLDGGFESDRLIAVLARGLLREDAEFHSYQMLEAGVRQYHQLEAYRPQAARVVLVAVARYLAAHAPTSRAMLQTARSAMRLHRGEELFIAPEAEAVEA